MFSLPVRVYWEDTDAGGVVYHAQYLAFLERARSEWMRANGYGQDRLRQEHDLVFAVRSMAVDFLKPARLDDALQVTAQLRDCRRASAVFDQAVLRDGVTLLGHVRGASGTVISLAPEQHVSLAGADLLDRGVQ